MERITITLDQELKERLEALADREQRSVSAQVRVAIIEHLARRERLSDSREP